MDTNKTPDSDDPIELVGEFEERYLATVSARTADVWELESDKLFTVEQRIVALGLEDLRQAVDLILRFMHRLPDELP